MSTWIDHKYINLLSPQLERFARKSDKLYNFRCPFCGDSQKNKWKARGYVYDIKAASTSNVITVAIVHLSVDYLDI